MKNLIVPTMCVLVGCAAGAALTPAVTAQWPDNPGAQRWQLECIEVPGSRVQIISSLTVAARNRAGTGFRYVPGPVDGVACFERPAP